MSVDTVQKGTLRYLLAGLVAGILVVAGAQVALAANTQTVRATVLTSVSSKCYQAKSAMNTDLVTPTGYAYGWPMTPGCASSTTVPSGWMYLQEITYRNGNSCLNKMGDENSSTVSNMTLGAAKNCGTGTYKSKAGVFAYNTTTGYYIYGDTVLTPNANF